MRYLIYAALLAILASLVSALVFLVRDRGRGTRTVRSLTWRIGLSLGLFVLIMAAFYLGNL
ncbi:MAG: twin transmembrane helix small protein [Thiobacillaceae bacterium]|nr:twin transmembrane helix small protein [Thiobacillaceae bacterium]